MLRREFSLVVALTGLKDIRSDRETSKLKHDGRTLKNNNKEIERKRKTAVIELKEIGGLE